MAKTYRGSRTLKRVLSGGYSVTPQQLADYSADTKDVAIVTAMASGAIKPEDIVEHARDEAPMTEAEVKKRLVDPVRCAWITTQLTTFIPHILGQFWVSLFFKAQAGDMQAAKLVAQRFDPNFRPTTRHESMSANVDLSNMANEDVRRKLLRNIKGLREIDVDTGGTPPALPDADS